MVASCLVVAIFYPSQSLFPNGLLPFRLLCSSSSQLDASFPILEKPIRRSVLRERARWMEKFHQERDGFMFRLEVRVDGRRRDSQRRALITNLSLSFYLHGYTWAPEFRRTDRRNLLYLRRYALFRITPSIIYTLRSIPSSFYYFYFPEKNRKKRMFEYDRDLSVRHAPFTTWECVGPLFFCPYSIFPALGQRTPIPSGF